MLSKTSIGLMYDQNIGLNWQYPTILKSNESSAARNVANDSISSANLPSIEKCFYCLTVVLCFHLYLRKQKLSGSRETAVYFKINIRDISYLVNDTQNTKMGHNACFHQIGRRCWDHLNNRCAHIRIRYDIS